MFERYTEGARQTIVLAQDEARALQHNYIGTEHLLLGLGREGGTAAEVLESLDITVEEVRAQVARLIGAGEQPPSGQIPFTPRTKKVLELALREALSLGHSYVGTEHILLGLVRENDGVAARILADFGADPELVRNRVIRRVGGSEARTSDVAISVDTTVVGERFEASRRRARRAMLVTQAPLLLAIVFAAVGFPLGLLFGWLIWG